VNGHGDDKAGDAWNVELELPGYLGVQTQNPLCRFPRLDSSFEQLYDVCRDRGRSLDFPWPFWPSGVRVEG
jgi:hypothetical protein